MLENDIDCLTVSIESGYIYFPTKDSFIGKWVSLLNSAVKSGRHREIAPGTVFIRPKTFSAAADSCLFCD